MNAPSIPTTTTSLSPDSNELAERSKGGVEHVSPGDTDSTSASPGNPVREHAPGDTVPQLDNIGDLSDVDQVLQSDQVNAAIAGGGILSSWGTVSPGACSMTGLPGDAEVLSVSPGLTCSTPPLLCSASSLLTVIMMLLSLVSMGALMMML